MDRYAQMLQRSLGCQKIELQLLSECEKEGSQDEKQELWKSKTLTTDNC